MRPGITPCVIKVASQRADLMVERLDTLHQLRRQRAQLFRRQMVEGVKRNHAADFARAGNSRRWIDRPMAGVKAV